MTDEKPAISLQNAEYIFNAYVKKVITQSRKRFDLLYRRYSQHEDLSICIDTPSQNEDNPKSFFDLLQINYDMVEFDPDPLHLERAFVDEIMYHSVRNLSPKQKIILHGIFFEDKTEQQIAEELKLTRQAVNKSKKIALEKISDSYFQMISGEPIYKIMSNKSNMEGEINNE